jgi:cell wall-associated NlpC family hydrolase
MTRRYSRCRYRRTDARGVALAAAAGLALAALAHAGAGHAAGAPGVPEGAAARAIAYAKAQLGCPYTWGGTGPCGSGLDCSGLVMRAWASAGVTIARTSQEQWAAAPQVSDPQPGDLVFFAGGDGTRSAPGHVGLVVDPARHLMIDAYEPGVPVRYDTYGLPGSAGGLTAPVGFTDPAAAAGRSS